MEFSWGQGRWQIISRPSLFQLCIVLFHLKMVLSCHVWFINLMHTKLFSWEYEYLRCHLKCAGVPSSSHTQKAQSSISLSFSLTIFTCHIILYYILVHSAYLMDISIEYRLLFKDFFYFLNPLTTTIRWKTNTHSCIDKHFQNHLIYQSYTPLIILKQKGVVARPKAECQKLP